MPAGQPRAVKCVSFAEQLETSSQQQPAAFDTSDGPPSALSDRSTGSSSSSDGGGGHICPSFLKVGAPLIPSLDIELYTQLYKGNALGERYDPPAIETKHLLTRSSFPNPPHAPMYRDRRQ